MESWPIFFSTDPHHAPPYSPSIFQCGCSLQTTASFAMKAENSLLVENHASAPYFLTRLDLEAFLYCPVTEPMPDRCKACDHPRPDHGRPSTLTTTVAAMAQRSDQGCIPCSVFMKTLTVYFHGSGEEIPDAHSTVRLYFNVSAVTKRSLEIKIVAVNKWAPDNTGSFRASRLSLYCVKSEFCW